MQAYFRIKCLFVECSLLSFVGYYPVIIWHNPDKWQTNNSVHLPTALKWQVGQIQGWSAWFSVIVTQELFHWWNHIEISDPPLCYCYTHFILKVIARSAFRKIRSSHISPNHCQCSATPTFNWSINCFDTFHMKSRIRELSLGVKHLIVSGSVSWWKNWKLAEVVRRWT